jgi:hypothetical protein
MPIMRVRLSLRAGTVQHRRALARLHSSPPTTQNESPAREHIAKRLSEEGAFCEGLKLSASVNGNSISVRPLG